MPTLNDRALRILIIEDEPLIALDLRDMLVDAGFEIAGIGETLAEALELVRSAAYDAVVMDANLAGISAGPAAVELTARGVPFVVVSGYTPDQQPDIMRAAPFIDKPCRPATLVQALHGIARRS